ncbi:MAG: hypothetical protein ABI067_07445 [Leifsonia sp.]
MKRIALAIATITALTTVALLAGCSSSTPAATHATTAAAQTGKAGNLPTSYTSKAHGFTINFPSKPSSATHVVSIGGIDITEESVQWTQGNDKLLAVGAAVLPEASVQGQSSQTLLLNSLNGAATNMKAQIENITPITIDGLSGMSGTVSNVANSGQDAVIAVAMNGNTQYTFAAAPTSSLAAFLRTFKK